MSDVWTIELEKEEPAITAELAQQSGESYTLPMAGPDVLGGVKPAQKTNEMTKRVGIDENGRLWSEKESEQVIEEVIGKYLQNNPIISEETDPTVPEWAKQPNKPTYTAAEVGALPADTPIPEGGIPIPSSAQVGQTIVVKAVDENGKPTEWEAADFPADGGGEGNCTEWKFISKTTTEEEVSRIQIINENPLNELWVRYTMPPVSEDPGGTIYARPVFIENGAVVANINAYAGIKKPSTTTHRCNWHITPLSAIRYEWNASTVSPPTIVAVAEEPMERIRNAYSNGGGLVGFDLYWNQDKTFPVGTSLEVWGR